MSRRTRLVAVVLIVGLAALTVYNWVSLLGDAQPPAPVAPTAVSPGGTEARSAAAAPARVSGAASDAGSATPPSLTHVRGKRGESARDVAQRVFGDKERWRDLALRNGLLETERLRDDTALLVDLDAVVAAGLRIVRDPFRLHDTEGPVAQRAAVAAPRRARKLLPISDAVSVSVPEDEGMTAVAFIRGKAYGVGDVSPSGRILEITQEGVMVEIVTQAEPGAGGAPGQRKASTNEPASKMVIEVEK